MKNPILLAALALGIISTSAHALPGLDIGVVGGANYNISSYSNSSISGVTVSQSGGVGYSLGLEADLPLLNIKALYSSTQTKTDTTSLGTTTSTTTSTKSLQIPVHYSIGLAGFSIGVGGFFEKFLDSGSDTNYGVSAGAKASLPGTGIFAEGLVNYGLKSINSGKTSSAMILVGMNIL